MPGGKDAAERWRALVRDRRAEMDRLARDAGAGSARRRQARRFAARASAAAEADPFMRRLRRVVGWRTSVLDVGAGPGRFALGVAPRAAGVVAVDPSRTALSALRRRARQLGLTNVRTVEGRWEDVEVGSADVAFSAFVLPLVADAVPFLRKLDAAASRHALLYLGAFSADAVVDPLWRHFHGRPRRPAPTYLDAVAVLEQLGIRPDVAVVEVPTRTTFASLDEAVAEYADHLVVPRRRADRAELRRLLSQWLVARGAVLAPPMRTTAAAVLSWRPAAGGG